MVGDHPAMVTSLPVNGGNVFPRKHHVNSPSLVIPVNQVEQPSNAHYTIISLIK